MKITMLEKIALTFVLLLVVLIGYTSVQAANEPEKIEKKEEYKSRCFCNGLNSPQERQCPTMEDLNNGIFLGSTKAQ